MHDKKLADESGLTYPEGALLIGDSVFQGYTPAGITTWTPKKKPRKRDLFDTEKARSRFLSKLRVGVEHVICGVSFEEGPKCRAYNNVSATPA